MARGSGRSAPARRDRACEDLDQVAVGVELPRDPRPGRCRARRAPRRSGAARRASAPRAVRVRSPGRPRCRPTARRGRRAAIRAAPRASAAAHRRRPPGRRRPWAGPCRGRRSGWPPGTSIARCPPGGRVCSPSCRGRPGTPVGNLPGSTGDPDLGTLVPEIPSSGLASRPANARGERGTCDAHRGGQTPAQRTQPRRRGALRLPGQRPFAQPRLRYGPTEVVSADELEAIHDASLRILAEIGMNFLDPESRDLLAAAGAEVDGERVRFDPDMVVETHPHLPVRVPAARAEPGPHAHDRRRPHRLRVGRQPAQPRRPRRRAPARRPRRLPRPAQAVPDVRHRPLHRRLPGRADRPALVGAPPRGGPRRAHAHRQGAAQLQPRPPAQPRRARDGTHRPAGRRRHAASASRRCSPSSTRRRRCASTPRCCRASSSSRRATRSS